MWKVLKNSQHPIERTDGGFAEREAKKISQLALYRVEKNLFEEK